MCHALQITEDQLPSKSSCGAKIVSTPDLFNVHKITKVRAPERAFDAHVSVPGMPLRDTCFLTITD